MTNSAVILYVVIYLMYVTETRLLGTSQVFASEAWVCHFCSPLITADQSLPAVSRQFHVCLVTN